MRKNPRTRYAPIVALTAVMPSAIAPALARLHLPDGLIGAAMGFPIGLAIVALVWIKKGKGDCATG